MLIDRRKYIERLKKVEHYAARHPVLYKIRLCLYALWGYVYLIALALLIGALLIVGVIGIIMVVRNAYVSAVILIACIAPIVGAWSIIESTCKVFIKSIFYFKTEPPGIPIKKAEGLQFFERIELLRNRMDFPGFDKIIINDELNASVIRVPKFGIFGFNTTYLVIGLPLFYILSADQLMAVIAHEAGHIAKGNGKFRLWINEVRNTWLTLLIELDDNIHISSKVVKKLYSEYIMGILVNSHVINKEIEHKADAYSVSVLGKDSLAGALLRLSVYERYISNVFWREVYDEVKDIIEPPDFVYLKMKKSLKEIDLKEETMVKWLKDEQSIIPDIFNTHPDLESRLAAIGEGVRVPKSINNYAFEMFSSEVEDKFLKMVSNKWKNSLKDNWKERHEYIDACRKNLIALEDKAKTEELDEEEAYAQAVCAQIILGNVAVIDLLKGLINKHPKCLKAKYNLGKLLVEMDNSEGAELIDEVVTKDSDYIYEGCSILFEFYFKSNNREKAYFYYNMKFEYEKLLELSRDERKVLSVYDRLTPHNLDSMQIDHLKNQFQNYPLVRHVYLVKKDVKLFKERPLYIMFLFFNTIDTTEKQNLLYSLYNNIELPGEIFMMHYNGNNYINYFRIKMTANSKIF